jgi:DNA-binding GntR family transcriptional regulator
MDADTVYRQLREEIISGVYRAGDRLPEVTLSTALAVSRTPVREALRRLESDGLVQGSGRGVAVAGLSTPDVQHAYAVRAALEALTAELAAERQRAGRLAPAAIADLEAQADRLEEITAAGDLERAAAINRSFHQGIAALAGNPIAAELLDRLWNQITVSTRASLTPPDRPSVVAAEHRDLLAAIKRGDRGAAGQIAGRHAGATAHAIDETQPAASPTDAKPSPAKPSPAKPSQPREA